MTKKDKEELLKILRNEFHILYKFRYDNGIDDETMEEEDADEEVIWLRGRYYELTTIISKLSKTFNLGEERK